MLTINWESTFCFLILAVNIPLIIPLFKFPGELFKNTLTFVSTLIHISSIGLFLVPLENYIPIAIIILILNVSLCMVSIIIYK